MNKAFSMFPGKRYINLMPHSVNRDIRSYGFQCSGALCYKQFSVL